MKYISLIVAAFMGISFALAAPTLAKDTLQGLMGNYTIADIQWEVPISPDRTDTITVTGTIEDVIRHLEVVAPELLEAYNTSAPDLEPTGAPAPFDGALVRTPDPSKVTCGNFPSTANKDRILQGIGYLKRIPGKPKNGPNSCGRVSCSYKSAIFWCNYNTDSYTLDSFNMIGDGAQAVVDHCVSDVFGRMNGESDYDGGWGVSVMAARC